MHVFPYSPRHDPAFRSWLLREHCDVLEEMTVGIVEEHRRRWHPGEDNRLVRRSIVEIKWRNARRTERARGSKQICEAYNKCRMRRDSLRPGTTTPQSKHRVAWRPNPEEGDLAQGLLVGQPQADDVLVKRDCSFQIGDIQVNFKETVDGDHVSGFRRASRIACTSASGISSGTGSCTEALASSTACS
jgi:hypothetical protein